MAAGPFPNETPTTQSLHVHRRCPFRPNIHRAFHAYDFEDDSCPHRGGFVARRAPRAHRDVPATDSLTAAVHEHARERREPTRLSLGRSSTTCKHHQSPQSKKTHRSRANHHPYNDGSTTRVRRVDVTSPPMTTVASGRWTSAPAVVDSAIGRNPKLATEAVINTGLSL